MNALDILDAIETLLRRGIVVYSDEQQQIHIRLEGEPTTSIEAEGNGPAVTSW